MRYDWSISLSSPLNSKVCFDGQNVSGRKFWWKMLVPSRLWRKTSDEWRRRTQRRQLHSRTRWFHRHRKVKSQTQKEKNEKDGIRVENVWRVCEQQIDATLDKQNHKEVPMQNCRRERHRQYFKLLKKHAPVLFILLVFLYLPLVLLQKPCKVGSAPKRRLILLSSRLQTSAPFPTMSLILFSPPGSFH